MLDVGDAVGFATLEALSEVVGDHAYVYGPVPPEAVGAPPIGVPTPGQMLVPVPALAVGDGFTVTVTVLVEVLAEASVTVMV